MAQVKDNIIQINEVYKNLNTTLDENIKRLNAGAVAVEKYNKIISIKPSEYSKGIEEINTKTKQLEESQKKIEAQVQKTRLAEIKLQQDREKAFDRYEQKLKRETELRQKATEQARKNAEREGKEKLKLTAENQRLNRAYNLLVENHKRASNTLQDLVARGRLATQTQKQYNQELNVARTNFERLDNRVKQADHSVRIFNRNVGNYPKLAQGVGSLMSAFGLTSGLFIAVGLIKNAFQSIKEFDQASADLAATMGKTRKETKALTDDARRLGASTKWTATEITGLQKELAKLGFSEYEILNSTKAIQELASAVGTDLVTATEVGGATLRGFGLDASEMQRVVDVMANSFTASALDISNFRESMKYVAPMAKASGVSIEFTTAMLSKLADAGVKGSMAGTSLRRILTEMANTGLPTAKAFDQIAKSGISVKDAMDEVGRTAQTSLLILADNKEEVLKLNEAYKLAGGTAEKMAKEQLNTLQGSITLLTSAWDGFIQSLNSGDGALAKTLKKIIDLGTHAINLINWTTDATAKSKSIINSTAELEVIRHKEFLENKKKEIQAQNMMWSEEKKAQTLKEAEIYYLKKSIELTKQKRDELRKENKEFIENERIKGTQRLPFLKARQQRALVDEISGQTRDLKFFEQRLKSLTEVNKATEKQTDETEKETQATTKNTASKKEQTKAVEELLKGTEAYYNKLISDLKKEQSTLADSSEQYKIYADAIAEVEKQLNLLKNGREKLNATDVKPLGQGSGNELEERLKAETEALIELNNNTEKGKELMKQYADEVVNAFGMDLINNSGLTNFFDLIENGLDRFGDNWQAKTTLIMEATQEMFNFISGLSRQNFDEEYEREARRKETALLFAGESAEAKAEIERESERRTREIRKREAKAQRSQAMFNIGIDTAQAIMRAWATNPKTAPFMTAIISGVGIAQIASIASRPLPEFWKGTDNAPEGLALTQERGREIITDAKGIVKSWGSDNGAQLTHLNKGDKVLKHSDTMRELNNIMAVNNILPPKENILNFAPIERKLDKLTGAILNKESFRIISDSNGKRYFEQKNGQNQELKNARLNMTQRNV